MHLALPDTGGLEEMGVSMADAAEEEEAVADSLEAVAEVVAGMTAITDIWVEAVAADRHILLRLPRLPRQAQHRA